MSARDGPEYDELDVRRSDAPRELAEAEKSAEHPHLVSIDEARHLAYAEQRQRAEGGWEPRPFEAPRAELARFDPERAGLPRMSLDDADSYLEKYRDTRSWLAVVQTASPEARLIFAALDSAGGHGHIRHEGWVTEWANMRRVACLEDPAQTDPAKRSRGVDGLKQGGQLHYCGIIATRITDPDAFATAFARGVEHPKAREALEMVFDPRRNPRDMTLSIADLLGSDGHQYCTGWQLEPVDGSMKTAGSNRKVWAKTRAEGQIPDVSEPNARPVTTFAGGGITFAFGRDYDEGRYVVSTMFSEPAWRLTASDQLRNKQKEQT